MVVVKSLSRPWLVNILRLLFALALGVALPAQALSDATAPTAGAPTLQLIAPGVYMHQGQIGDYAPENHGDLSNVGVVVGQRCVAVIDTGGSITVGEAVRSAIRAITPLPVCAVIFTHMHLDHVFGAKAFVGDAPEFIANAKMPRALLMRVAKYRNTLSLLGDEGARSDIVIPTRLVDKTDSVDLGGRTLSVRTWPTAHTDNDLTVYDDVSGTLFLGDLAFREHTPVLDGNLKGWLSVLTVLHTESARQVVPGHGPLASSIPNAIVPEEYYLQNLRTDITSAIHAGKNLRDTVTELSAQPAGEWKLFDLFHPRNVTAGYAELEWNE
jgi:quinoprotein relay system zinc metallohydrolase 2